jgi:hypothetical protein
MRDGWGQPSSYEYRECPHCGRSCVFRLTDPDGAWCDACIDSDDLLATCPRCRADLSEDAIEAGPDYGEITVSSCCGEAVYPLVCV